MVGRWLLGRWLVGRSVGIKKKKPPSERDTDEGVR